MTPRFSYGSVRLMSPTVGPMDVQIGHIQKYIQDIIHDIHKIPSGRGAALAGPAPRRRPRAPGRPGAPRGRAGQGGPAAARYFVHILYYILDIFGYVQFGHPSGRKIIVKHFNRSINRTLPYNWMTSLNYLILIWLVAWELKLLISFAWFCCLLNA